MKKVTDQQVIDLATQMGATMAPFTDLVANIRQTLNVSNKVAGDAIARVLDAGLIQQEWTEKMVYSPTSAGNKGDPYWKTSVARWVIPAE